MASAMSYPAPARSPSQTTEQLTADEEFARRLQQEEFGGLLRGGAMQRFHRGHSSGDGVQQPLLNNMAASGILENEHRNQGGVVAAPAAPAAAGAAGGAALANPNNAAGMNDRRDVLGLNGAQQQLRRNVFDNLRDVDIESPRLLLCRFVMGLLEIIATATLLAMGWNGKCRQPLKYWVLVYTSRLLVILPLRIYGFKMRHNQNLTEWVKANNALKWLNVLTFLWFLVGQSLLFSGKSCAGSAPFVWYYCLVIVVCVYVALALPFLVVLAICLCLPCVLIVYRFLAEPEGANAAIIENLETHTFERPKQTVPKKKSKKKSSDSTGTLLSQPPDAESVEVKVDGQPRSTDDSGDDSDSSSSSEGNKAFQCAICIMDYENGDVIKSLPCGHEFHSDCIDRWLPMKKICPLCRHDITKPSESGFLAASAQHRQESGVSAAAASTSASSSVSGSVSASASASASASVSSQSPAASPRDLGTIAQNPSATRLLSAIDDDDSAAA